MTRRTRRRSPAVPGLVGASLAAGLALGAAVGPPGSSAAAEPQTEARAAGEEARPDGVDVVFLANEGFLLRPLGGGAAVLIDAFVSEEYSVYGALPGSLAERLEAAEPPFDRVRLALVSHVHRDHFQSRPAGRFLAAQPAALLATSGQVHDALAAAPDGEGAPEPGQLRRIAVAAGETVRLEHQGTQVEVLHLRHGGRRHATIENLGHVIHVGGRTVLHVGDADQDPEVFAPYRLAARGLDVALIPYWFFFDDGGRKVVTEHLRAEHTLAVHVPPAEVAGVREALAERYPHVLVPSSPLESHRF